MTVNIEDVDVGHQPSFGDGRYQVRIAPTEEITLTANRAKMRNHEVQRAYLEQWLSPIEPRALWYVDLSPLQQQQAVSVQSETPASRPNGSYRCKANFAIEDYLYVPERPDGRDDSLEDEFSELESDMVKFCRAARDGTVHSRAPMVIKRALMGCLSHCFRDAYGWRRILQESIGLAANINTDAKDFPPSAHDWLVRNARRSLLLYEKRASALTWTIYWNIPVSLLTSDRPGWDLATRPGSELTQVLMPLGPHVMLIGKEPSEGCNAGELRFVQGREDHAKTWHKWNVFAVERARGWIVATSEQQLHTLLPEFTVAKYATRVSTEKLVLYNPASGKRLQ